MSDASNKYGDISISYILKNDGKIVPKISLPTLFSTPEALDKYKQYIAENKKRILWLDARFTDIEVKAEKANADNTELWEQFLFYITEARDNKRFLYHHFKDKIYRIAGKIFRTNPPKRF
jgi:hypothetical protein